MHYFKGYEIVKFFLTLFAALSIINANERFVCSFQKIKVVVKNLLVQENVG